MKRKLIVVLTIVFALISALGVMVACKPKEEPVVEGPETGLYYYDAEGSEYTVSLHDGNKVDLSVRGLNVSGTYTLGEDAQFTFAFGEELALSASYANEAITLTYDNSTMRFLRKVNYTVTFDAAGGTAVDAATVLNGKTLTKPEDPSRSGYGFVGWYLDREFTKPFAFGTQIVTSDVTVYAQWAEIIPGHEEFSIAFNLNYPEAPASPESITTSGGKLYGVTYPERSGYTFAGWGVSMYEDAERITTVWTADTVFEESTTLFALWTSNTSESGKLGSPVVSVSSTKISWTLIPGANGYTVDVISPDGVNLTEGIKESSSSLNFDFGTRNPGDYIVKVTAKGGSGVADSDPTERYFRNKALARVSRFSVVEPGVLLFNNVAHAQHYYITVDCGNPNHNHTMYDNNTSTNFNFSNCSMKAGGIKFQVTAKADGYADSVSREFVFNRLLGKVDGFHLDEATQILSWNAVEGASNYVVSVHCENPDHDHSEPMEIGNAHQYDLKECAGKITVSVYPKTKGYNSPAAESYTYEKSLLATPGDFRIVGNTLSWTKVNGASSYLVKIDGKEFEAAENQLDLSKLNGVTWIAVTDYKLSVCAISDDYTKNSAWSNDFDARYEALYGTMSYSENRLTWRSVIGAEYYEVQVNDGEIKEIEGGVNFADVVLTKPGMNTLSVRYFDGDLYSGWETLEVFAHTVYLDSRSGEGKDPIYVAVGDELTLPGSTRTGYSFSGWYNAPGGAKGNAALFDDKKFSGSGDVILYADWTPLQYHVEYNYGEYNAGEELQGGEVTFGEDFTLDVPTTEDGSVAFAGWYTQPNGLGKQYTNETGKSVTPWDIAEENVTLYAYWAQAFEYLLQNDNTYSVTKGPGISLLKEVTIPKEHTDPTTGVNAPVTYIEGNAFYNVTSIVTMNFYDTIVGIGVSAFKGCTKLEAINVLESGNQDAVYSSSDGVLIHTSSTDEASQTAQTSIELYPAAKKGEYTIPDYVDTIPTDAFAKTLITSVKIPSSVTFIGIRAFSTCTQLQSVIFDMVGAPTSSDDGTSAVLPVVLYKSAFEKCSALTYLNIPARAVFADDADFNNVLTGCTSLTQMHIEESHPEYAVVDGMVTDKEMTTILYCPKGRTGVIDFNSSDDPNYTKIRKISGNAFMSCTKITEVHFPSYLQEIEDGISSSGSSSRGAFYGCSSLTKVVFEGPSGSGLKIGNYAFETLTKLKSVEFEEGSKVSSIGVWAFYNCSGLTEFTIPATVAKIDQGAFMGCTNLETLTFGALDDTVEAAASLTFGNQVFQRCAKLKEVRLPANLETFPSSAFTGCTSLEHIYVSEDNEHLKDEDGVLYDKHLTKIVYYPYGLQGDYELPDSVVEIQASAFDERKGLTGITIGPNVTTIGNSAFEDCTNLTKVVFKEAPADGTSTVAEVPLTIGTRAFSNTAADISLPSRTVSIGNYAFEDSAITSVTIPAGITSLGTNLFDGCTYLTKVTLEEGVKEISASMFAQSAISEIVIPKSVTRIGGSAFNKCYYLKTVTFEPGGDQPLAIGQDVNSKGQLTASSSVFSSTPIEEFTFPGRTEFIGTHMFVYCGLLRKVTFETGCKVESFGKNFFLDCESLEEIFVPKTVTSIAEGAFSGLESLKKITFEAGGTDPLTIESDNGLIGGFLAGGLYGDAPDLEEVKFPARLVSLGDYVFYASSTSAHYEVGIANVKKVSFAPRTTPEEKAMEKLKIGDNFGRSATIGKLELPDYLDSVGTNFLYKSKLLSELHLPALGSISAGFLTGCDVSAVTMEKSDTLLLENGVIYEVADGKPVTLLSATSALDETINIPNTVTKVSESVFYENEKVKKVVFQEGGTETLTFSGTTSTKSPFAYSSLESIVLPARLEAIPNYLFYQCKQLTSVTFEKGESKLTSIGTNAFQDTALKSIVIPDSVTTISGSSYTSFPFYRCEALESITLPAKLTSLTTNGFYGCTALQEFIIAEGAENFSTKDGVLFDKSGEKLLMYPLGKTAEDYTIPQGTKTVAANAFSTRTSASSSTGTGNAYLTTLTVANTVTSLENYALCDMPNLLTIKFEGGGQEPLKIPGSSVFANNANLVMVTLPTRLVENSNTSGGGQYMFAFTPHLSNVAFENNEVDAKILFGSYAFYKSGISSFTVPEGVEGLAAPATGTTSSYFFQGSLLENFTFASTMTNVPAYLFFGSATTTTTTEVPLKKVDYNGAKITTIGKYAFSGCRTLTSLTIPDTVTKIGEYAFEKCAGLQELSIPASVKEIGNYAFSASGLTSFTLPATVTTVGTALFNNCKQLASVSLPDGMKSLPGYIFQNTELLKSVQLPASLTAIGSYAFSNSKVESVQIPESVTSIGNNAFQNSSLTSVELPEKLTAIGNNVFSGCTQLTSVKWSDSLKTIGDNAFQNTAITSVVIPATLTSIGKNAFNGCAQLTDLTFAPNGTEALTIGQSAFAGSGITSLTIPSRVTAIQNSAFQNAASLASVTFESGSEPISFNGTTSSTVGKGTKIFDGCVALAEVSFNNRVTYIVDNMFSGCTELREIIIPSTITKIGASAFMGDTALTTVTLDSGLESIGANAFNGDVKLENIEIPDTVTSIGANAFSGVKALKVAATSGGYREYNGILYDASLSTVLVVPMGLTGKVELPDSVFELTKGAFANTKITEVVLPQFLTAIPDEAFKGSAIQTITFGSELTSIGASAFEDCADLSTVTFGECKLATIGDNAFKNCTSLTSLALPETLTTIGASAFVGSHLATFNIGAQLTSIGANAFDSVSSLTTVTYSTGGNLRLAIGEYAFANSGLVSLALPARTRSYLEITSSNCIPHIAVNNYAFYNCTKLETVKFEETEEIFQGYLTFGDYAFAKCSMLEKIEFPKYLGNLLYAYIGYIFTTIPALGAHAFEECVLLNEVTFATNDTASIVFGESLFNGCVMLNTVNLPGNLTEISAGMFENSGISELALSESVKAIGAKAFANCTKLHTLTVPATVETVGEGAFNGWTERQSITVKGYTADTLPAGWDENWKGDGKPVITWNPAEPTD